MKRFSESRYFKIGLMIFLTGVALIIFYLIASNISGFRTGVGKIGSILEPFIYGFIIAYLMSPAYNFLVRKIYHASKTRFSQPGKALKFARVIASIASVLIILGVVAGLVILIVPQMVESVTGIIQTFPSRVEQLNGTINSLMSKMDNTDLAEQIMAVTDNIQTHLGDWAKESLIPGVGGYMQAVTSRVIVTLRTVMNLIIGIIICIYLLNGKEQFKAQARKLIHSFSNQKVSEEIFLFANYANTTFGNFINGKIIDSIIIGVICFFAMSILKLPYAILISVIVGITNIIPFFGPFIGAIPSIIIIALVSPLKALYFLILVLLLQQFDGNILGPRIIGNTTGLSSFWVMFAILVSGGLFGFIGMVVGVPVFAIIYYYIGRFVRKKLRNKGMPEMTNEYIEFNSYDANRKDILE